jgi:hypothetical protein
MQTLSKVKEAHFPSMSKKLTPTLFPFQPESYKYYSRPQSNDQDHNTNMKIQGGKKAIKTHKPTAPSK